MTTPAEWIFALSGIEADLPDAPAPRRHYPLRHGTMRAGLYAPRGADPQTPHTQDEIYIIVSGTGVFAKNGERRPFKPQDLIFVEAGAEHRFESFSDDFSTWVVFWGPEGGEG